MKTEFVEYKGKKYYIELNEFNQVRLRLSSLGISDIIEINGLDKFTDLDELYLGGNNIKEIKGLDSLTNLKKLRLGGNKITEIKSLNKLKNLQSLRLSGNQITEIQGLETLTKLEYLRLQENPIRKDQLYLLTKGARYIVKFCQNELIAKYLREENQDIEHKESFRWDVNKQRKNPSLKEETTKAVCAFLNSNAGKVVIGVDDDGNVKGIEPDLKTYSSTNFRKGKDRIFQDITTKIREDLGTKIIHNVDIFYKELYGQEIVTLEVKPSLEPVYHLDKNFIVRDGPASVKLEGKNLGNYIYSHFCLRNTKLNRLYQKFYNLLSRRDNTELKSILDVILNQIGTIKIQEILRMRLFSNETSSIIENDNWYLEIEKWEEVTIRRRPSKKIFSFKVPTSNEEILIEFLEIVKERCEESGLSIITLQ